MDQSYSSIAEHPLPAGTVVLRRVPAAARQLALDDPAVDAMTDLATVEAVRIAPSASVDAALERMKQAGVRLLFVANPADELVGVITSRDIEGEKPVQVQHSLGIARAEVLVRDVMTPRDELDVLFLDDVQRARVGDVVATLRHLGRQHALVADREGGRARIRGVFSTTHLGSRLGTTLDVSETAHTFAAIGAALR